VASLLTRYVGLKQFDAYKSAFAARGALTLFLARFAFAIRAVAYIAAGAAHYPWRRFLVVDALSVAVQVALFVGVGYYAGEHIEWALTTGEKLVVVLGLVAALTLVIAWVSTFFIRRFSGRKTP
jgi:membrane protein DedA with SNARE-associated domain